MRATRVAVVVSCLILAAGCTSAGSSGDRSGGAGDTGGSASPSAGPLRATLTPDDGARKVRPDRPVKLVVSGGTVASVTVTGKGGKKIPGATSSDKRTWTSSGTLHPSSTYRVVAKATNGSTAKTLRSTFRTLTPKDTVKAAIAPLAGTTVGVGQPIAVYLSSPVSDRAAVEKALKVTTDKDVTGVWHWFSDKEVHFRPKAYWPAHTKVILHADLAGVHAAKGTWGIEDRTIPFTIGARHVSVVNAKKHSMKVMSGDKVVRRMPVSTGRPQYPTKSGIHVVSGKADPYRMDSTTAGITGSNAYVTTVRYAVRISNSGEFVHAAPWSAGEQGRSNVSHGCVNVSLSRGEWFYHFSQPGDIVKVTGTPATLAPTNGFGDWNVSWSEWVKGSALH